MSFLFSLPFLFSLYPSCNTDPTTHTQLHYLSSSLSGCLFVFTLLFQKFGRIRYNDFIQTVVNRDPGVEVKHLEERSMVHQKPADHNILMPSSLPQRPATATMRHSPAPKDQGIFGNGSPETDYRPKSRRHIAQSSNINCLTDGTEDFDAYSPSAEVYEESRHTRRHIARQGNFSNIQDFSGETPPSPHRPRHRQFTPEPRPAPYLPQESPARPAGASSSVSCKCSTISNF